MESVGTSNGQPTRWLLARGIETAWASTPMRTVSGVRRMGRRCSRRLRLKPTTSGPAASKMINFRVHLGAMLAQLRTRGADVAADRQDMDGVVSFGWVTLTGYASTHTVPLSTPAGYVFTRLPSGSNNDKPVSRSNSHACQAQRSVMEGSATAPESRPLNLCPGALSPSSRPGPRSPRGDLRSAATPS